MNVLTNLTNWDPVALLSILMVIVAIVIVVFLSFKISALMKHDAEARKNQRP
jgi:ABC-type Fe3+-siderophore transport system permease subunit